MSSEVTITQDGKPVAGATITLQAEPAKPQTAGTPARAATPPKPKTNTNNEGKVVVVYDDEKTRDDDSFTLILRTRDGRTIGRLPGVTLAMLRSGKVDVPRQASTPARTATQAGTPAAQSAGGPLVTDFQIKYGGGAGIGVLRHEGHSSTATQAGQVLPEWCFWRRGKRRVAVPFSEFAAASCLAAEMRIIRKSTSRSGRYSSSRACSAFRSRSPIVIFRSSSWLH